MSELTVTYGKLERYCKAHGGYDLERINDAITLTFVPSFPEAQDKGDAEHPAPRIIMQGQLSSKNNKVTFLKVEIEDEKGIREKEIEDARLTYQSWLEYIEDNY